MSFYEVNQAIQRQKKKTMINKQMKQNNQNDLGKRIGDYMIHEYILGTVRILRCEGKFKGLILTLGNLSLGARWGWKQDLDST